MVDNVTAHDVTGIGIYAKGTHEAVYTGGNLSTSQIKHDNWRWFDTAMNNQMWSYWGDNTVPPLQFELLVPIRILTWLLVANVLDGIVPILHCWTSPAKIVAPVLEKSGSDHPGAGGRYLPILTWILPPWLKSRRRLSAACVIDSSHPLDDCKERSR